MSGLVKSIFGGGGDAPAIPEQTPEQTPPPSVDEAVAAREREDAARKRKGRAAYVLTGKEGTSSPTSATKALLGG